MSLFHRKSNPNSTDQLPAVRFGRYTDVYHTAGQDAAFEKAVLEFEKGNFLESYLAFFRYLKNDNEDNVKAWIDHGKVRFELCQGSKLVTGFGDEKKLFAQARVARARKLHPAFMRRMLEENHELRYSRFVLTPDQEIAIYFESYTIDGSPYKLYDALKELATYADKHDDLLLDEFSELEPADLQVKREIPQQEKEIKYQYIVNEISRVLHEIDHGPLDPKKYPSAISYLLLFLCCKLDYLTCPEGHTMETLERIHRLAFSENGKTISEKNAVLREEFSGLLKRPREKFFEEMYEVRATFGITAPVDHRKVMLIIRQELPNMTWYQENGYENVALAVPGFIASRCLFYYAVPAPDRAFFHFLLQVVESPYFVSLGFPSYLKNGKPDEKKIKKEIKRIADSFRPQYPKLNPDLKKLRFRSTCDFAASCCWMVHDLDLSRQFIR